MKFCELCRVLQTFTTIPGGSSDSAIPALPEGPRLKISEKNAKIDGDQRANVTYRGKSFLPYNQNQVYCSPECSTLGGDRSERENRRYQAALAKAQAKRSKLETKSQLSISDAARLLNVSRPTIYRLIDEGTLSPSVSAPARSGSPESSYRPSSMKARQTPASLYPKMKLSRATASPKPDSTARPGPSASVSPL